jgi:hypothetical protein
VVVQKPLIYATFSFRLFTIVRLGNCQICVKTVAGKIGLIPITKNFRDIELFTFDIPYRGMVI